MSYRNIEVDGQVYRYTIGKTHTKIVGVCVIENTTIGNVIDYADIGEQKLTITPSDIHATIQRMQSLTK